MALQSFINRADYSVSQVLQQSTDIVSCFWQSWH